MPTKKHKILNALLYQAGWFAVMLNPTPACGLVALFFMLLLHLYTAPKPLREATFIGLTALTGYGADAGFDSLRLLDIHYGSASSLYLLVLWLLFATALRSSLAVVLTKKSWAFLLGLSAPLAYWAGQNLGRVHYTEASAVVLHSLAWATLMLFFYYLKNKLFDSYEKL